MILKLFIPVLFLLFFQLISLYFYNGFNLYISDKTIINVSFFYVFTIAAVLLSTLFLYKNYRVVERNDIIKFNKKNNFFIIFLSLIFVLKPTIILIGLNIEMGGEYVRKAYFSDPNFFNLVYGRGIIATFTNYYIVPFLWFYLIYVMDKDKGSFNFTFYFLLILLIMYNASYSGRFFIYFSLIVLYLRCIVTGISFLGFFRKNIIIILFFILASYFILVNRQYEYGAEINFYDNMLSIFEYHAIPPYLLSQKIDTGTFVFDQSYYPFRVVVENLLIPIYILFFDGNINDLIYFEHVGNILSDPTLYSNYSMTYYNAYGTMFYFFYADTRIFSPIFVFIMIGYIFLSSKFINDKSIRVKYLAFVSLILYFSLFQAMIFSPGYLLIIFGLPLFYLFFSKRNR